MVPGNRPRQHPRRYPSPKSITACKERNPTYWVRAGYCDGCVDRGEVCEPFFFPTLSFASMHHFPTHSLSVTLVFHELSTENGKNSEPVRLVSDMAIGEIGLLWEETLWKLTDCIFTLVVYLAQVRTPKLDSAF